MSWNDHPALMTFARQLSEGLGTGKYATGHSGFCSSSLQNNIWIIITFIILTIPNLNNCKGMQSTDNDYND